MLIPLNWIIMDSQCVDSPYGIWRVNVLISPMGYGESMC